jgi:hypothetical protein
MDCSAAMPIVPPRPTPIHSEFSDDEYIGPVHAIRNDSETVRIDVVRAGDCSGEATNGRDPNPSAHPTDMLQPNNNVPRRKLPYSEGDWIAVPLPQAGWSVGIIARSPRLGNILFGYFFPYWYELPPAFDVVSRFQPSQAVLIAMFGDLGILQGRWKVIGRSEIWNRFVWPMTSFAHYDLLNGRPYIREYTDDGDNRFLREEACNEETAKSLPKDGLLGSEALERRLALLVKKKMD